MSTTSGPSVPDTTGRLALRFVPDSVSVAVTFAPWDVLLIVGMSSGLAAPRLAVPSWCGARYRWPWRIGNAARPKGGTQPGAFDIAEASRIRAERLADRRPCVLGGAIQTSAPRGVAAIRSR